MGDAIEDELAGEDGFAVASRGPLRLTDDNLMIPSFATSGASAPPAPLGSSNNTQTFSWGDLGKTAVAGVIQGIFKTGAPAPKPVSLSSSGPGISTGVVLAGVGAAVLVGVLLLRRQSA